MQVRPPRALVVDRPLGFPLGAPHEIDLQKRIVTAALELLAFPVQEPLLVDFPEEDDPPPTNLSQEEINILGSGVLLVRDDKKDEGPKH